MENQIAEFNVIVQVALDVLVDPKALLADQPGRPIHAIVTVRHQTGLEELQKTKERLQFESSSSGVARENLRLHLKHTVRSMP